MELRHLRYAVAVAEELHFGRAAARLGIAQPPLSQQIRRLEGELGVKLFQRTNRRVQLTEPGRIFLEEARAALAQADRAVHSVQRAGRGEIGRLEVGFVPWADFTSFTLMIRIFGERRPEVHLELASLNSSDQVVALRAGHIHVGFMRPLVEDPLLVTEPVLSEPIVLILPARHRLVALPRVPVRALAEEPFILLRRQQAPVYYDHVVSLCREAGFALKIRHEADHPQTILGLVAAGIGVSLVPVSFTNVARPGVVHRPLRPAGRRLDLIVAWRRDGESPLLQAFLDVVREVARRRWAGRSLTRRASLAFGH